MFPAPSTSWAPEASSRPGPCGGRCGRRWNRPAATPSPTAHAPSGSSPGEARPRVSAGAVVEAEDGDGVVGCPLAVLDEPGKLEQVGGRLLWDAMLGAQGKPGSPLRLILIGTIAPFGANNWWGELIRQGQHEVNARLRAPRQPDRWDRASELRRVNPLRWAFPKSRAKLLQQRDEAERTRRSRRSSSPTCSTARPSTPSASWYPSTIGSGHAPARSPRGSAAPSWPWTWGAA